MINNYTGVQCMKKVILTALLIVSVGTVQCEESFARKSVEDLRKMHEFQMNAIKKTVEYKYVQILKHEHGVLVRLAEEKKAKCEAFRKSVVSFFWSEDDCRWAPMYEAMAAGKAEAFRDADDRLTALVTKDYPALERLTFVIAEKQLAIAEKQNALNVTKSGQ
jgi:hypothetical protein